MNTILVITPRFPYPVIGGDRLRIYEICKELSKNHNLILASLCETQEELEFEIPDDAVFNSVHRVFLPKWKSYLQCILSLPTKTPLQVAYYKSSQFSKLIDNLSRDHDLVLSHLIRMADYAKDLPNKKVLEMTDAISMNYSRVCETKNNTGLKGFIYRLEKERLNCYEKEIAEKFDCNVLVSKYDKDFLFLPKTDVYDKTLVCSNGVDISKLTYEFSPNKKEVVFIGNMFSAQNFDAAMWFAKECLPLLRKHGDYTFKVIGRIKPDDEIKLKRHEGVIITGAVDCIITHARGAIAGICSVRLAAGVQNKILEYMALGLPTITTTTGLEGLDSIPDKDILVADLPQDFVQLILRLENDVHYAEKLSANARKYVEVHHSWSGKLAPLSAKVNQILSN
ncbi:glycosyl transferase family 1 [Photobacterium damselae]|uniref:Glycosyl transferase family 1 n=1 Tax=Photobacterium damselae TaxID=38293 RepID=A0ACD3SY50_PHODM|nr:glycosyltransferase family 4 protein [Photobacterium damselae]RDL31284.1 glycosyl transferase family 1 [Photobacterium damselae]TMX50475.1 glycosyl transferase family 1 [Photobacterium damselae]TMX63728.1 glycosyl transferase family 1 [Photobacterium damselae]TMX70284.1 glycosyl transferase family 1 [Photobacterium damselae]